MPTFITRETSCAINKHSFPSTYLILVSTQWKQFQCFIIALYFTTNVHSSNNEKCIEFRMHAIMELNGSYFALCSLSRAFKIDVNFDFHGAIQNT